jgi:hypothetical protein
VPLKETVASCKAIMEGKHDNLPEGAFYMVSLPSLHSCSYDCTNLCFLSFLQVGGIEEAISKGEKIAKEN